MKKSLGKMVQPSVMGSRGGATTLLYVVLIVVLWLSITERLRNVRSVIAGGAPQSGTAGSGTLPVTIDPGALPNPDTGNGTIDDWLKAHGQYPRTLPPGGIGH